MHNIDFLSKMRLSLGRSQKIQIPSQNPSSPGTLESDFSPDRTLLKILILGKILEKNDTDSAVFSKNIFLKKL